MPQSQHISIVEWLVVLCIAIAIDASQIILDLVTAGVTEAIWPFIDIIIGAILGVYLWFRGQKLSDPKRFGGLLATFGLEITPLLEDLPLWSLDVAWNWFIADGPTIIKKAAGGDTTPKKDSVTKKILKDELKNLINPKNAGDPTRAARKTVTSPVKDITRSGMKNALSSGQSGLAEGAQAATGAAQGTASGMTGAARGMSAGATGAAEGAASGAAGAAEGVAAGAAGVAEGAAAGATGAVEGVAAGATGAVEGVAAGAAGAAEGAAAGAGAGAAAGGVGAIPGAAIGMAAGAAKAAPKIAQGAASTAKGIGSAAKSTAAQAAQSAEDVGENTSRGIEEIIKDKAIDMTADKLAAEIEKRKRKKKQEDNSENSIDN